MQKISFLLLGTSLSFLPQTISAQCVSPIQDCYALGYTQTSCPNGKGVKCPFGSGWYCGGTAAQDCIKLGYDKDCTGAGESGSGETCNGKYQSCTCDSSYKYTCSGTGYSGGSGTACGGKYTACTCASSYEWKDGNCQQQALNGPQGDLYYCNNKVVGVKASGMDFYVAMSNIGYVDDGNTANNLCQNYVFCNNATGTLPTSNQLITIRSNKQMINSLFTVYGGNILSEDDFYWSSSYDYNNNNYYVVMMTGLGTIGGIDSANATYNNHVRPILTSW